jgi:DNA-binding IclR family transcriptional regulator
MNETPYPIQVLVRALKILETVAASEKSIGPTELSQSMGISKNVAFRILYTLNDCGWIDQRGNTGRYVAGKKCRALGETFVTNESVRLRALAHRILETI